MDNQSSFVILLKVSDLIDVILYWKQITANKNYTSIIQALLLYVVVNQRNILNKV